MPQSANTAVYRGREGTGAAQILGGSIDPLKVMMANQAKDEAKIAAEKAAKRKARTDALKEQDEWAPGKRWDIDEQKIRAHTRNTLQWYAGELQKGRPINELNMELREKRDEIEVMAAKSRADKEKYEYWKKYLEKEKDDYVPEIWEYVDDAYMNEDGMGYDIMDRKPDQQIRSALENPELFNKNNIYRKFVESLPTEGYAYYEKSFDQDRNRTYKPWEVNAKFLLLDENNRPVKRNGDYVLQLNNDIIGLAKQNPKIAKLIETNVPNEDPDEIRKYLESEMFPWAGNKYKEGTPRTVKKSSSGSGNRKAYDYEVVMGKDETFNDYQTAVDNNGLLGKETVTMDVPHIADNVYIGDDKTIKDVQRFHQDGLGNRYVLTTSRTSGDRVREERVDFDKAVPAIRNSLRTKEEKEGFDQAVNDFIQQADQAQDYFIDYPKLNQFVDKVPDLLSNDDLFKNVMREYGLENVSSGTSLKLNRWQQPYIDIEGQTFYIQEYGEDGTPKWEEDDTEKLKQFLINKIPSEFKTTTNDPLGILNSNQNGGNTQQRGGSKDPEGIR